MATAGGVPVLERPELRRRIRSALDAGSLLVVADAGFGKTTALREALDGDGDSAWVRCRDSGADPGRLLGLAIESIRGAVPGAADVLAERLAAAREPVDPEQAAAALERELARLLVDPLVLVFDDVEALEGSPGALAVVARLLEPTPPRCGSRWWRAADRRFASPAPGPPGGWPRSAARSSSSPPAIARPTCGSSRGATPIPTRWKLSSRPRRDGRSAWCWRREAAARPAASWRTTTSPRRCWASSTRTRAPRSWPRAWRPTSTSRTRRASPRREGLAVVSDRRYHPLFRDFLRERFEAETTADRRRATAVAIAGALDAAGRGPEAVEHRLAGEDWDAAAEAVAREGPALVRTAPETVGGWLEALPPDCVARPELMLLAGELAHGAGRLAEAVELCRDAVAGFDANGAPPFLRFAARFALADVFVAVGDLGGAAALGETLDDPAAEGDLVARAVGVVAAAALARQGRLEEGRALCQRAFDDPAAAAIRSQAPAFDAYYVDLPAGRLDDALAHVRQAIAVLERGDPFGRLPYVLLFNVAIHEERGEFAEALALAARGREMARRAGLAGWVGAGTAIRTASMRVRMGDVAGAEADLAEVKEDWRAWGAWELEAIRAALAARRGDGREARAAAERAAADAEERWPWFDRLRCAALLAPTLARAGHPARAQELVERTLAARIPGFSAARLQAVLAWLLHEEGDAEGSVAALAAGWEEAGDQARHLVRHEWPRIEGPLWVALERGAIEPEAAIGALAVALPGGAALGPFTRHPAPAVRRAALLAAVSAGHPEGVERIDELAADPDPGVADAARAGAEQLRRHPPPLAFRLLGGFELRRGSWTVDESAWQRRVAQRLVRLLLCRGGGPVVEDELIEAFWPDKPAAAGRRSLQVAVSAARAVLDPPGAENTRLVALDRAYSLHLRDGDSVDSVEFERAAAAALAAPASGRRAALGAAAGHWTGEPLPEERYEDWAIPWRERLIDRYAEVLAALADAHVEAGDLAAAVEVARRLVALDPLDESGHRRLIAAYARAGRRGHALRQFLACRRTLVAELGVEPGEETAALQRRVLAGEPV